MTTDERKTLNERTEAKVKDPELMNDILAHVSSGGTLIDLCKTWDVPYHRIVRFIYENDDRKKNYEQSLAHRDEYFIERIRKELHSLATVDLRKAYTPDGRLLPPKEWPDELASSIAAVETMEEFQGSGKDREYIGDTVKVKLWDKLKALELLGKNLKMFIDRHEVSGKLTLEDLLAASMKPKEIT